MQSRTYKYKKRQRQKRLRRLGVLLIALALGATIVVVGIHVANKTVKSEALSQVDVLNGIDEQTELKADWEKALNGNAPNVAIAAYDHKTKTTIVYSTGMSDNYYMASTVKVSVLANLLYQQNNNDQELSTEQDELATNMIENSDNDATTTLVNDETLSSLDTFWSTVGMDDTHTDTDSWGLSQTTAADQVKLLNEIFYDGNVLPSTSRNYIKKLMGNVNESQSWGISSGLGDNATYELKNGWLEYDKGWIVNSIGHVKDGDTNYTLAIYTYGSDSEDEGIDEVNDIAEATYKYLTAE